MSKNLFDTLDGQVRLREWTKERRVMEDMAKMYEGEIPKEYEDLFPKNMPKHLVQVIPLAWDDLATQSGRLPDLRGEPGDLSRKELKAVGLQEKIGFSYLRNAKPTGKSFMRQLAWWLQLGRAVAIVEPDFEKGIPRMSLRDPRTCYPGIKESVNNSIIELSDLIFKYELPIEEARKRGLAPEAGPSNYQKEQTPNLKVTVIEYVDAEKWVFVSEHGMQKMAFHNLGIVPGHVFQSFTPNLKAGRSRFKDQVSIAVAISRLITAKMAYADRLVNPIMWSRGHEGMIEIGPHVINKLGPNGELGQLNPPTQLQVDSDIQMLNQFSRILNRNPEVRQGEIQAKGQYTSAKTLEQLSDAIDTVVGGDWDIIGPGMEYLLKVCFTMDNQLWPDIQKTITGEYRGKRYLEVYTPKDDIGDRVDIRVDYGFGVGGYQGFLMHLQAKDAQTMSRRRTIESMPGVTDVDEEINAMDLEAMDEAGKAMFMQMAAQGQLDMIIWSKLYKMMASKGLPLSEAIEKYQEALQEQAAAVAEDESTASMTAAPQQEQLPEEELPGVPPEAVVGF